MRHIRISTSSEPQTRSMRAPPRSSPDDGERRETRRPQAQRLDGDHQRRLVSRARSASARRRGRPPERLDQVEREGAARRRRRVQGRQVAVGQRIRVGASREVVAPSFTWRSR